MSRELSPESLAAAGAGDRYLVLQRRRRWWLLPLLLLMLLVALISLGVGPYPLTWKQILEVIAAWITKTPLADPTSASVLVDIRAPRVIVGLLVGGALAASGVVFQSLFRNPMADPYVIGVSSGAAFGAVLQMALMGWIMSRVGAGAALETRALFAFTGGAGAVAVVYRTALRRGQAHSGTLLLAGVAVSAFLSALTAYLLLQAASGAGAAAPLAWLLGGLQDRTWSDVWIALPGVALSLAGIIAGSRAMNLMLLGDESARQLGISPEKTRRLLVLLATLATASAVAVSGIIGFVGLVIPHLVRLIWGPDHRTLAPASILAGAGFLVLADTLARVIVPSQEIPVGIVTALAGAPFFLSLLRSRRPQL